MKATIIYDSLVCNFFMIQYNSFYFPIYHDFVCHKIMFYILTSIWVLYLALQEQSFLHLQNAKQKSKSTITNNHKPFYTGTV